MRLLVDIETDGLYQEFTKIHSIVAMDVDTRAVYSFADQPGYPSINEGGEMIFRSSQIIGHNLITFDIPVLEKYFGTPYLGEVRDTLILSKIMWNDIFSRDAKDTYYLPKHLFGSYSLEAFGYRLMFLKGDYKQNTDWKNWSEDMQRYCERDVQLNYKLYMLLVQKSWSETAYRIERDFQEIMWKQELLGVPFDAAKAVTLQGPLKIKLEEITQRLQAMVPPKVVQLKKSTKTIPYNPGSTKQTIEHFKEKYQWKPTKFTEKGNPCLDRETLDELTFPEVEDLKEYANAQKVLGFISEGKNSWLNLVKNGRLHGRVDTMGTVTARCTHSSPNLGQVPSVRAFMGKEMRSLFYAPEGYKLVGADASGLELRLFAHYLFRYDRGVYASEVVLGDVHTKNMKAAELASRDDSKRFIYAFLYGGGDEVLGGIIVPHGTSKQKKEAGNKARQKFLDKVDGLRELMDDIKEVARTKKKLKGIDGRMLMLRHEYTALNTLLQNAGAVCVKLATNIFWQEMQNRALDSYAHPALHVHDEFQTIVKEEYAEEVAKMKLKAIEDAGKRLDLQVRLSGEYKIGNNWSETH